MSDLKLLGRLTSGNVMKVTWTLAELDLPFTREDIGGKHGGNNTPAYLALNPNGLVPTLIDGSVVLWESNTICRYLCNKAEPTTLYPEAPAARALCERWMDWQLSALSPLTAQHYMLRVKTAPDQRDEKAIAAARDKAADKLKFIERVLANEPYIAGPQVTLADVAFGFAGHRWFALGADQGEFKNLRAWYERLKARAGYNKYIVQIPIE